MSWIIDSVKVKRRCIDRGKHAWCCNKPGGCIAEEWTPFQQFTDELKEFMNE